jgi:hypothetical protein
MLLTAFLLILISIEADTSSYQVPTIKAEKMEKEYFDSVDCVLKANPIMKCWKNNCARRYYYFISMPSFHIKMKNLTDS